MKEFTGHTVVSFRRRDHKSVLADAELTIFGLPPEGQGEIKVRRIAVMQKADGERWVAWPRDKYEAAGKGTQYYNFVVSSGGGAPYQVNAWILEEFAKWEKTAPPVTSTTRSQAQQPVSDAAEVDADVASMFK